MAASEAGSAHMSLYQLQKLIYHVNRDPSHRERYRQDPAGFVKGYELTPEEESAVVKVDFRKLYILGVHSLLLRPFTLLHKVSNDDYAKALAGLE
jgi:Aromatic-ring-opening dioxygenase LigAB, LigA subunit